MILGTAGAVQLPDQAAVLGGRVAVLQHDCH
jgi:hypothetical protein